MKYQTRSIFSFSKKELNGIFILFVLCAVVLMLPFILRLFDEPEVFDPAEFRKEVEMFRASAEKRETDYPISPKRTYAADRPKAEYFPFDPNGLLAGSWMRLGLTEKQIRVIKNYEAKGGRFYTKEDLKKIYSISSEQYQDLAPYIRIKNPVRYRDTVQKRFPRYTPGHLVIEINTADSAAVESLRGIGPVFASRIIRFRDRLGGFHHIRQLKEVYGIDSVKYEQFTSQMSVDSTSIKKIDINTVTFEQLKRHPYLTYKQMNALLQYRQQHGIYRSASDLRKVLILNDEIIRKIEPYLNFAP